MLAAALAEALHDNPARIALPMPARYLAVYAFWGDVAERYVYECPLGPCDLSRGQAIELLAAAIGADAKPVSDEGLGDLVLSEAQAF